MAECTPEERELLDRLSRKSSLDAALEGMREDRLRERTEKSGKKLPTLYLCCPTNDKRTHSAWTMSALLTQAVFHPRVLTNIENGTLLPRNRDIILDRFIDSGASHMLCVDGDISWHPKQIEALLDTGKPFVSGTYCKKGDSREIPAKYTGRCEGWAFKTLFSDGSTGEKLESPLWECEDVPAGFLLIERAVVEQMVGHFHNVQYKTAGFGMVPGLWHPNALAQGEDIAFCRRWREMGGEIWMHRGVVLDHIGEYTWRPDERDVNPAMADRLPGGKHKLDVAGSQPVPQPEANGVTKKLIGTLPVHIHADQPS